MTDQTYDNQSQQHYQQQNLEQYTADGQSERKSDAVNEITQPPTLTNVPVQHANDSQYQNKYAPVGGDEEESSTTYSENVNIPQQILNGTVENMLPVGVQGNIIGNANVPPNYLESETDESSTQQVKEIINDESDFDFSAN
ncbi:hypothetical protein Bhyg_12626 [Pseudolycoriella hygida]|uniref:Uncharacterized protein n=1 Tax=Pseudolycoriella hygida TaxID=35572 RepID=A0A9Q0MZ64_9DIPT|nr:hypothetical protein Bhyg_12626 [Pseudolycoriella hygida]